MAWISQQIRKFAGCACAGNAVMHVGIAKPRWRGKRYRHSRRMRNPQFNVSGKRPMGTVSLLMAVCKRNQQVIGDLRHCDSHVTSCLCLSRKLLNMVSFGAVHWHWRWVVDGFSIVSCLVLDSNYNVINPCPISKCRCLAYMKISNLFTEQSCYIRVILLQITHNKSFHHK